MFVNIMVKVGMRLSTKDRKITLANEADLSLLVLKGSNGSLNRPSSLIGENQSTAKIRGKRKPFGTKLGKLVHN